METYEKIKMLRENNDLTQKEIAESLKINISVYKKIELGTRPIRENELAKLADFFSVSTDYLLGRTNKKYFELSPKEEKDIGKQVEEIIEGMQNDADINFYGEPMTEEDKMLLANSLEIGLRMAKEKSKKKFTPKKYRNQEEEN